MHDIYHVILKNRKIDRLIMPFEALYCVWLIITLILNFKLFAYSIDAQFVLITLFYFSGWISSLVKKPKMKQKRVLIMRTLFCLIIILFFFIEDNFFSSNNRTR